MLCLQPINMKSSSSEISNEMISGWQVMHPSLPPYLASLASISPMERATDSRPGDTRKGPTLIFPITEGP